MNKIWGLLVFSQLFITSIKSQDKENHTKILRFEINYETLQSLSLKNATLYTTPDKLLGHSDSLPLYYSSDKTFHDTLLAKFKWEVPVHAKIKLEYTNQTIESNKFFLDPLRNNFIITITDTLAIVKPKPLLSFEDKNSYMGIILLFQILLEIIIASLLVRFFRWPAWVILVVLVANLATFPIYQMNLKPVFISDLIMLLLKFIVIYLTGRKRLGIQRIIILVLTLTLISFGFKEIFILIVKVL